MIGYIIRRLLTLIPILLGVSIAVFLLMRLVPGDPVLALAGPNAEKEDIELLRVAMGMDGPVYKQYLHWLSRSLQGDLGRSLAMSVPVVNVLVPRMLNTLILAVSSLVIAVGAGVGIGILAGSRQNSAIDRASMVLALIGASVPTFWLALLAMSLFAVQLRWFPATGMYNVRGPGGPLDLLQHLIMPSLATAAVPLAIIARLTRSVMMDVLQQDFITMLRANGVPETWVIVRHALRNALPPVVNIIGLQVGALLSGALFTEVVFAWPGLGSQLYNSIAARDISMIQASVLFVSLIFVLVNLFSDLLVATLDPRVRAERA